VADAAYTRRPGLCASWTRLHAPAAGWTHRAFTAHCESPGGAPRRANFVAV